MNCPQCDAPFSSVRVSGTKVHADHTIRRRHCLDCHYRWLTKEHFLRRIEPTVPLGTKDIRLIREAVAAGATQASQAKLYGVSPQHINRLVRKL